MTPRPQSGGDERGAERAGAAGPAPRRWVLVALLVGGAAAGVLATVHLLVVSPETAWLADGPGRGSGASGLDSGWMLYPHAPRAHTRPAVELDTRFRAEVSLDDVPRAAPLRIEAFRRPALRVNGAAVPLPEPEPGHAIPRATVDAAPWLRPGTNTLEVRVWNDRGPPAVRVSADWAATARDGWRASLAGAEWRSVRLAGETLDLAAFPPEMRGPTPLGSLRAASPVWLAAAALAVGAIAAFAALRRRAGDAVVRRAPVAFAAAAALAWVALFANNAPSLVRDDGFDARGHLAYLTILLTRGELPSAGEGWSTFQPPLFYAVSAGLLRALGHVSLDGGALTALRVEQWSFGVAQLLLVFACLRQLAPGRPGPQIVGTALAAALPVHLYVYQTPVNDGLAATLSTAGLWLCLRSLAAPRPSAPLHLALGACLGGALLAKATAIVPTAILLAALAARCVVERRSAADWLASVGAAAGACALVAGGFYLERWLAYGSPFVGNWDPRLAPAWWQDPGFATPAYLLDPRPALESPFVAAFRSLPAGLYATLWSDALLSGRPEPALAPPWNLEWMAANLLLALVPTALVGIGAAHVARRFLARPEPRDFALLGLAGATLGALLLWTLTLPVHSVVKAHFGLPSAAVWCAFAALGFERVASRRALRGAIGVAVTVFALSALASFWVPRGGAALARRADFAVAPGASLARAVERTRAALASDPDALRTRLAATRLAIFRGRHAEASRALAAIAAEHPLEPEVPRMQGRLRAMMRDPEGSEAAFARLLALRPRDVEALRRLADAARAAGRREQAVAFYRRALAEKPHEASLHRDLAAALPAGAAAARYHADLADRLDAHRPERGDDA